MKKHKMEIRSGITFQCEECDFKTAYIQTLKHHKEAIHEGVKYSCDLCEYTTGWVKKKP